MMYIHPYIQSVAKELARNGKRLQFKSNSFFKNIEVTELSHGLGDKLLAEVSMYKNDLFPAMKYFKTGLDSAISARPINSESITHQFIDIPVLLRNLVKTMNFVVSNDSEVFDASKFNYVNKVNLDTIENPRDLFCTEKEPATKLVEPFLQEMTEIDMKNFYSKYCIYFTDYISTLGAGENIVLFADAFCGSPLKMMLNAKNLMLVWAAVTTSLFEEYPTNTAVQDPTSVRLQLKTFLENKLGSIIFHYDQFVKDEKLVIQETVTSKEIYLIRESFDKFTEGVTTDTYSVLYGSSAYINNVLRTPDGQFTYTVKELLDKEEIFLNYYKRYLSYERTVMNEKYIQTLRRQILHIASDVYTSFMTLDLKDYSSFATLSEFEHRIVEYIKGLKDEELYDDSSKIACEVIGEILFDRTNFGMFLSSQSELGGFMEHNEVYSGDEVTLWTINYLIKFIVSQLEVV